ncbi:uncharacterized protein LOC120091864 [Benincasa hispida]|uniref:uncharacterized protein LOC120091864 n=1 Tax=Benincasa hispida TaxID=102211 RepID=UPI0018FF60E4|nr:uncharacterized protein LOC120091864 [Benincasa hispida]
MANWSAENATEAFLNTLKMGQKANEPDVGEFISAMAAGNNAQLMVVAYEGSADHKVLALAAAAVQTGGRVVCIIQRQEDVHVSQAIMGVKSHDHRIEFMVGEAEKLIKTQYREADFVLIDCNLEGYVAVVEAVRSRRKNNEGATVVVGFNAMSKRCGGGGWLGGSTTHLLPIGKGLIVTKVAAELSKSGDDGRRMRRRSQSQWVVKVDKCTGEEHVFRVRLPQGKVIQA